MKKRLLRLVQVLKLRVHVTPSTGSSLNCAPHPGPGPDQNLEVEVRLPRTRCPSVELNASLPLALLE